MERLRFTDKKILIICLVMFAVGMSLGLIKTSGFIPHHMSTVMYCGIIFLWWLTLERRLISTQIRVRILAACVFMLLLFFFKMCKFSFFPNLGLVNEHLWYAYYIPMTAIPLFYFLASLHFDPVNDPVKVARIEKILVAFEFVICIVVMTNHFHGQVFRIITPPDKEYTRQWFYFVIFLWMSVLGIGTLVMFFRKCVLSAARKLWFIPAIFLAAGFVLLFWYIIGGGPPKIMGHKLFHFQEAYCLPFITGFESLILIGVVPANTGYEKLFDRSRIGAVIYDLDGRAVLRSAKQAQADDDITSDEDIRLSRAEISGGYVTWMEDLSAVNRLNSELAEVAEELEDENDLIRQESEIRAERISFETRNRLYNRISVATRPQALKVGKLLSGDDKDTDVENADLIQAAVLSAYIKRMGNLILLSEDNSYISSGELRLSIGESMDYIRLSGSVCELDDRTDCELPLEFVMLCYELFETAIEEVWDEMHSCLVNISLTTLVNDAVTTGEYAGEGRAERYTEGARQPEGSLDGTSRFRMSVSLDARADSVTSGWKAERIKDLGASLSTRYEDETYMIDIMLDLHGVTDTDAPAAKRNQYGQSDMDAPAAKTVQYGSEGDV